MRYKPFTIMHIYTNFMVGGLMLSELCTSATLFTVIQSRIFYGPVACSLFAHAINFIII